MALFICSSRRLVPRFQCTWSGCRKPAQDDSRLTTPIFLRSAQFKEMTHQSRKNTDNCRAERNLPRYRVLIHLRQQVQQALDLQSDVNVAG